MYGNQMINAPWGILEKEAIEGEFCCNNCKEFKPDSEKVETTIMFESANLCRACNDTLKTCADCGEKILDGEKFEQLKDGKYVHFECAD